MSELNQLRADLYASVKDACLAQVRRSAAQHTKLSLPAQATIDEFAKWLSDSSLPVANARLIINMERFAPGASRLVGLPDMPDELDWPHHTGKPLAFLAQIDLASLPRDIDWPVPRTGWLYFFVGANRDGIEVGDVDASPNRALYFGGDVSDLRTRSPPDGVLTPFEFSGAVPYSVSFELGVSVPMAKSGSVAAGWEQRFENLPSLDLANLLLDRKPPVIRECKDRMFGLPRSDQTYECQFQAAATAAGYGPVMHLSTLTLEAYRRKFLAIGEPPAADFTALFEKMKERQSILEQEAQHWCSLFSLGSHLHGSTGRGGGVWHFLWGDAQTYRVLIDGRKSRVGDFSQTFIHVSD